MAALKSEEFSDFSSAKVIGFDSTYQAERIVNLVHTCIGTDPMPEKKDESVETNEICNAETQTQTKKQTNSAMNVKVDEKKLSAWLKKIYPAVESELRKGPTPKLDDHNRSGNSDDEEKIIIRKYQKISHPTVEGSHGLAVWLSIHTDNVPVLVLTTKAPHDGWCTHDDQTLKVYIPEREPSTDFIVFTLLATVPLKSCLRSLSGNFFNRDTFSGSTMSGTIHIWRYEGNSKNGAIKELFSIESPHGCVVGLDWADKKTLFTCHTEGWVVKWTINDQLQQEENYLVKDENNIIQELKAIVSVNRTEFVVGTLDGSVLYYTKSYVGLTCRKIEFTPLKKHKFTVSSLLRTKISGRLIVLSCDLSGQVFYHDIPNCGDDDGTRVIAQIPLPFKNAIACSKDGNIIYCPGVDGALELYRIMCGSHMSIRGALQGKGNMIRVSDNGYWIVTGLYGDDFQIFKVDD